MTHGELRTKLSNRLAHFLSPWARGWLALNGVETGKGCRLFGFPIINKTSGSAIHIGLRFTARSTASSNSIGVGQPVIISTTRADAKINIGDDVGISGCSLSARQLIQIGNRVSLGSGVLVLDNDAHSLDPVERASEVPNIRSEAVILDDDVFIGARSIILKGTKIGPRTIVRAGSVVMGEFSADCLIGGNPAIVLSRK